jgi:hypothetical protein
MMLFFQSASVEDDRIEAFIEEVKLLAEKHRIEFGEHQSMMLPSKDYRISKCKRCGYLTVNKEDIDTGVESMLPDFWFYVHQGSVSNGKALCDECALAV